MKFARWLGVALVGVALIGLPVAIWVSERWGLVLATLGTVGLVILGAVSRFARDDDPQR